MQVVDMNFHIFSIFSSVLIPFLYLQIIRACTWSRNLQPMLTDLKHGTKFSHTEQVESYYLLHLKCCPKCYHFAMDEMEALAALPALGHLLNVRKELAVVKQPSAVGGPVVIPWFTPYCSKHGLPDQCCRASSMVMLTTWLDMMQHCMHPEKCQKIF